MFFVQRASLNSLEDVVWPINTSKELYHPKQKEIVNYIVNTKKNFVAKVLILGLYAKWLTIFWLLRKTISSSVSYDQGDRLNKNASFYDMFIRPARRHVYICVPILLPAFLANLFWALRVSDNFKYTKQIVRLNDSFFQSWGGSYKNHSVT